MKYSISVMTVNIFNNMRKPTLISLSNYCPQVKEWDVQDLIKSAVQKEDVINHVYAHPEIPKMSYPKMRINWITGHSFFSKILP